MRTGHDHGTCYIFQENVQSNRPRRFQVHLRNRNNNNLIEKKYFVSIQFWRIKFFDDVTENRAVIHLLLAFRFVFFLGTDPRSSVYPCR